jgi:trans-2-enoyl-CoA reductase
MNKSVMRVLQHASFGDPAEVLEIVELPIPEPRSNEAVIEIEAASIHAGDLKNIAGEKIMLRNVEKGGDNLTVELPQVPGIEGIGRIIAAGSSATRYAVGDRVLLPWQCGSWRSHICVPEETLMPAPSVGSAVQLALMVNAFTAYFAITDLADLQPGDWFVQNAANSNVGQILIRLAHARGIRTVNIVRRIELVDELKAIGADVVLLDSPDLLERLRAEVGDAPLMIGLDSISGDATGHLAACLTDGATIANMGTMSGEPCHMPMWILHYKRIALVGYYAGHNIAARTPEAQGAIIAELAAGISAGNLQAKVAGEYPLEEFKDAVRHAALSGKSRDGKVVFVINK